MPIDAREIDFTGFDLVNKYQFKRRLGRGGYAPVWLAEESPHQRQAVRKVAIKVFTDTMENRSSFQQTVKNVRVDLNSLAKLSNNNPIVQYHNSEMENIRVDEENKAYTGDSAADSADPELTLFAIVMEYADGGSLNDSYQDEVVLRQERNIFLDHFIDVCKGLEAAHKDNIIHRDIKPSNLMWFKKSNKVKIGDFGIAKDLGDIKDDFQTQIKGAYPYMAPEAFEEGRAAAPERDIYALGCTFYELLAGEIAFFTHTGTFTEYQQLHNARHRPEAETEIPEGFVSFDFGELITKMMSVDPLKRPPLGEIIEALEKEKGGEVQEPPPSDEPPKESLYLSKYNVHPEFRKNILNQSMFFIFFNLPSHTEFKYRHMFKLLNRTFGDAYSIFEIFGRYDFLIRVWADDKIAKNFCEKLVTEVLDDDKQFLNVIECSDITFLNPENLPSIDSLSKREVLANLNKAQKGDGEYARAAVSWLKRKRIYMRKLSKSIAGSKIKTFCLLSQLPDLNVGSRASFDDIIAELKKKGFAKPEFKTTIYRKEDRRLGRFNREGCDFIISHIAPKFDQVVRIPELIVKKFVRLKPITLLATKRYYIVSDKVRIPKPN